MDKAKKCLQERLLTIHSNGIPWVLHKTELVLIQVELTIIRFPRNSAISKSHAVYLNLLFYLEFDTQWAVFCKKRHWDKPPMCTKKLCFSYVFTFALAKRQIKTLRCSFHFVLYLYYYLCQLKRKFRIRSRTFKALLFHVSMTWSQPKSNQLQFMISSAATTFQCCHTRGNVAVNNPLDKSLQCETNCVLKY